MKLSHFYFVTITLLLFLNFQSLAQENHYLPLPKVVCDNAVVLGKIDVSLKDSLGISELQVIAGDPFMDKNESRLYKIKVNDDGTFGAKILMICEGIIGVDIFCNQSFWIGAAPNQTTYIHVFLNKQNQMEIECNSPLGDYPNEIRDAMMYCNEIWNSTQTNEIYTGSFSSFDDFVKVKIDAHNHIKKQLDVSGLTIKGKQWATFTLNLFTVELFFSYLDKYMAAKNDSCKFSTTSNRLDDKLSQPDCYFYNFLKQLNLNDPYYLYAIYYQRIMSEILDNKFFNIPDIDHQPLIIWASTVKDVLKNILGFDNGLFYDMLVASAYYRTIWLKHSLTEAQKKDIDDYFTNRDFVRYLLNESQARLKENERNKSKKVVVVPTPSVQKEHILNAIVEKYRGKVIFIDFWATWCGPCLAAMPDEEEAKEELKQMDDVVYVYLTNTSSSRQKWEAKIQGLEGEHYYLDGASWESAMEQLGFTGIPSYVIYDKSGKLIHKQTMFMGKENMVKWIKELL